ncbi:Ubiquitin thioesterase OTUB1 [Capsicum chinense]|nr:Ubiquitin thioesterase OTUB1 [Capsicum chinense]
MLVGDKESLSTLEAEYLSDEIYKLKVKDLATKYKNIRRTRPDGNCFFRAFAYAYFESLLDHKEDYNSFYNIAVESKKKLISLGFPQFTLEDFHDTFMEVLAIAGKEEPNAHDELHAAFNNQGYSNYVVVYLRLLASGQLQQDADFYQHFIEGDRTITEFCHQEVEPMFRESDHIHIIALSTALNVGVRVRYLDRGESTEAIAHDFPEGTQPTIHLLYRPSHYDILYPI